MKWTIGVKILDGYLVALAVDDRIGVFAYVNLMKMVESEKLVQYDYTVRDKTK